MKNKSVLLSFVVLLLFTANSCVMIPAKVYQGAEVNIFEAKFKSEDGTIFPFELLSFKTKEPERFPLILALHGKGNTGKETMNLWKEDACEKGYMILAPTLNYDILDADKQVRELSEFIDAIAQKYPVDRSRIFLAGVSVGAGQARRLYLKEPKRWKGLILLASSNRNDWMKNVKPDDPPILFVHGEADEMFPVEMARKAATRLKEIGVDAEIVTDPAAGHTHDIWWNADIFKWLEKHSSSKTA